jgi:hypothetical protein
MGTLFAANVVRKIPISPEQYYIFRTACVEIHQVLASITCINSSHSSHHQLSMIDRYVCGMGHIYKEHEILILGDHF